MNVKKIAMLKPRPAVVAALAFMGMLGASATHAALTEEGTPLSIVLDHNISRDSNIGRSTVNMYDTVNRTGLRLGFDKAYGRQTYKLSGRVARTTYHELQKFDNTSSNLDGSFSTEIASNWTFSLAGVTQESLASFEENGAQNRLVRNIKSYKQGSASLQYGVNGLWALAGTYQGNRLSYSEERYQYNNANQTSGGLRLYYYSTDLLYYGIGYRNVDTEYPVGRSGLVRTDDNIDLFANWQITGLSNLNARLSRAQTHYNFSSIGKSSGLSGELSWNYRPEGLLVYNINLSRDTSADRNRRADVKGGDVYNLTDSIANSLSAAVSYRATAKTSFKLNYELVRFEQDDDVSQVIQVGSIVNIVPGGQSRSYYRSLSLSMNYQILPSIGTSCTYSRYQQSWQINERSQLIRPQYDGNIFGCNASFTLNL